MPVHARIRLKVRTMVHDVMAACAVDTRRLQPKVGLGDAPIFEVSHGVFWRLTFML